ncbi:M48 family metallopeptidase [Paracoccus aerodenitrificans]|uniref:M48 family metallopeptidase n=1 Tax=Paracoccus aerodenitrificans TaxID=3017781 RepID=UPI0022F1286D|nr:SprT family zinc-dependent metalloprotease [Paracoccus aerodenitrificans]WBU65251.1 SprT family zinc-dependent metalloprotease [Paracoccus aerodenitrificans]
MTLRVPRTGGDVVLTLPPRVTLEEGRGFAASRADWLQRTLAERPPPQIVADGAVIPVSGQAVTVIVLPVKRVRFSDAVLAVPSGKPVGPTVRAWLKHHAHAALRESVDRHAANLGRQPRAMTLRDTRSRWGSCTSDGRLMFSWRLAMAPYEVLDYVAAHEVAHLAHMDHSPRFWAAVERLMPDYARHRAWLRVNGSGLQAWRFED